MNEHFPVIGVGSCNLSPDTGVFGQEHFRKSKPQGSTAEFYQPFANCSHLQALLKQQGISYAVVHNTS